MAIFLLSAPHYASAATILDETGFIFGFSGENYSFVADQTPLVYKVTLTDFEFPSPFDLLGVAITTSTDKVAELMAPGMTTFEVELGATYFANVLGSAADPSGAGLFGINVVSIPEPGTLLLMGVGLFGLFWLGHRHGGAPIRG
jgi:hypothetical protein